MKKQKRLLLISIALIFTIGTVFTGCGGGGSDPGDGGSDGGGEVINWSFYTSYGPNDGACTELWPILFNEVKEKTDGRLNITIYWGGQHPYEESDLLKALDDGAAQVVFFFGGYLSSVDPIFGFEALPLMLPIDSMKAFALTSELWGNYEGDRNGFLERLLQDRWGATMVHRLPPSPQRFFSSGFEIKDVNSLAGKKIRTYNAELAKLVEIMGGTPVPISFSEVYTSLATNLIDGLITSTAFAYNGGFFDYTDVINKWEIAQGTDGVVASLDALEALPDDLAEIFLSVMRTSAQKPEMLEIEQNEEIVERLVAEGTAKVVTPTQETWSELRELCKTRIWDEWLKQCGPEAQQLLDELDRILAAMN